MSAEAVAGLLEQVAKDPNLLADLDLEGKTRSERIAAVVELGAQRGFEFTPEECRTILATAKKVQNGELDDAQLEAVAGGGWLLDLGAALQRAVDSLFGDDDDDEEDSSSSSGTAVAGVRG